MFRSRKNIVHTCNTEHSLSSPNQHGLHYGKRWNNSFTGRRSDRPEDRIELRTGQQRGRPLPGLCSHTERWPTPTCCDECSKKRTTGIPTNPSVPQQTFETPSHWPAGRSPPKQFHVGDTTLPGLFQTAFISFAELLTGLSAFISWCTSQPSNSTSHGAAFATPAGDKSLRWLNVTHIGRPRCQFAASHRAPTVALNFK